MSKRKGVKGVALDVPTAADAVANFQQVMMDRFKFEIFHGLGIQ